MKLFVGITFSEVVRAKCMHVVERLRSCGVRGRYERDEKLHVTLAFLGYVDAERLGDVADAMQRVAVGSTAFEFALDKIGAFPNERAPRVVYLGSRSAGKQFRSVALLTLMTYEELGFTFTKDAVTHVSLVRVGPKERAPLPMLDVEPVIVPVNELTLVESLADREHRTSRYEVRSTARLLVAADSDALP